jgi:disulfide bond formation protein DsbB
MTDKKTYFRRITYCLLTAPRGIAFVLLNVALLSLLFALVAEFFWQVKPCVLCLYQRYVYWALAGSALLGMLINLRRFSIVYVVIALAGLAISGYHIGVEEHWWNGPDACSAEAPKIDKALTQAEQIKAFRDKLKKKPTTVVRCDDVNWRIIGVSATIWTFLLYLGVLVFLVCGFFARKK